MSGWVGWWVGEWVDGWTNYCLGQCRNVLVYAVDIVEHNVFEPELSDPVKQLRRNNSAPTNIFYSTERMIMLSLILLGGVYFNLVWMVNHYGID